MLPTEKSEVDGNSAVRRWTFGKREKSKNTKTILLVGETGTGKSTLINTMVNFMLGVRWEDRIWFQITEEDKKKSQAESQTSAITVYELFLETSSSCLRIIDTPGYGATDGIKFDQRIAENLYMLFRSEEGIHEIEAVCLVVKASQNRLTTFECYIFNAILSLFGKDIERNIVVFITHSDGLSAHNATNALKEADVPCGKDSKGKPLHFKFNNSVLFDKNTGASSDEDNFDSMFWKMGKASMNKFFTHLNLMKPQSLTLTKEVLEERRQLKATIEGVQPMIRVGLSKLEEIKTTKHALQNHETHMKENKDFTYEVEVGK